MRHGKIHSRYKNKKNYDKKCNKVVYITKKFFTFAPLEGWKMKPQ